MSGGTTGEKTATNGRYRALLDASSAIADQPTVKAVLHSLRDVLSSTFPLHGTALCVLDDDEESLHVLGVRSSSRRARDQDWHQDFTYWRNGAGA